MKRILGLFVVIIFLLSLISCSNNYSSLEVKENIAISQNGIIEKNVLDEIKKENSIAVFQGKSGNFEYRWTIFPSELTDTRDVNLSVQLEKTEEYVKIKLSETKDLGFSALLSIYLDEKWDTDGAKAYCGNDEIYSVSITGTKTSILNISIDKIVGEFVVLPQEKLYESQISSQSGNFDKVSSDSSQPNKENESNASSEQGKSDKGTEKNEQQIKDNEAASSNETSSEEQVCSSGQNTEKDKYETEPVPEGKPLPVEPQEQEINKKKSYTCTFSIECSAILNNLSELDPDKLELINSSGVILAPVKVTFYEGETVFDLLQRVCKENGIHLEFSWTPMYNSAYIEGIHNLYEFDCGELSGWMYRVNGWYPNYGCSRYQLTDGEVVEWRYTCDLGKDIGEDRLDK